MNPKIFDMKLKRLAVATGLLASGFAVEALAHGYVSEPAGRPLLCKLGDNTNCGAVQWEPQSVEGPDGAPRFPVGGPEDGTIAAAGSPSWSELNAQSPSRWFKHDFTAGYQTFEEASTKSLSQIICASGVRIRPGASPITLMPRSRNSFAATLTS